MGMWAEADACENGGCPLVRPDGAVAVKHVNNRRSHRLNHQETRPPVIDEEMGDVVSQGEALLFGFVRSADEDETVAAVSVQATHQITVVRWEDRIAVVTQ